MLEKQVHLYRVHVGDLGRRMEILECRAEKAKERCVHIVGGMVLSEAARLGDIHDWLDSLPDPLEAMIWRACWWRNKPWQSK